MECTDDYYAILCVKFGAAEEVIKKSYRRLAIQLHPDKNHNDDSATASFQRVSTHATYLLLGVLWY
jgi:curved DNA-binding protein CbpA